MSNPLDSWTKFRGLHYAFQPFFCMERKMSYFTPPHHTFAKTVGTIIAAFLLLTTLPVSASVLGFVEYESTTGGDYDLAISPDGKYVYSMHLESVSNYKINVYSRNSNTGALNLVESVGNLDGTTTMSNLRGLAISPDGNHLYTIGTTANPFETGIIWFDRDSTSGQLSYGGRVVSGTDFTSMTNPSGSITLSPDGFFLYTADIGGWGSIGVFQRASNGVLTWVATVDSDLNSDNLHNLNEVYVSPDGKSLYATSVGGYLYVFSRNTIGGGLTPLQKLSDLSLDPVDGLPGIKNAEETIVTEDNRFLYLTGMIANDPGNTSDDEYNVVTFQRDTTDGTLTFLSNTTNQAQYSSYSDWDTLWWPTAMALSPDTDQQFLYVAAKIADGINLFKRDPVSGALSWVGWEVDSINNTELNEVDKMVLSPDGRHLYAALETGHGVSVFDTRADLSLVKSDDIDPVSPSATLTYTLAVTNLGPADAQNVVITDTLPAGVAYVSGSVNIPGGACSESAGIVTCTLGNLATTGAINTLIEVTAPSSEGSITNTASVTADQLDTTLGNNSDSEDTTVSTSGSSGATPAPTPTTSSSSSGGGGSADPLSLLLMAGLASLLMRRSSVAG